MLCISAAFAEVGVWMAGCLSCSFMYCVEMAEDTVIVAMECDRRPYPSFRLIPFSMTLNDS